MTLSRAIVERWMALDAQAIPATIRDLAGLHMLDVIGVGLAAGTLAQGQPYRRMATGNTGPCSLLTGARTHDAAEAAMINGGLIHALEFDDTHTTSIIHGSSVVAAAALAAGEAAGADLAQTLRAYLLGYEVLIRLGLGAPGGFQRKGFQVTSVAGTLAAALVAADLAGADEASRVHAVGIALSQSGGVFEFLSNGSTVKSLHPGWAAHAGILAARLAMAGLTGPETAIEGRNGLYASFSDMRPDGEALAAIFADFGERWHLEDVAFKFHPCCHYLHPFIEAARALRSGGLDPARIARIRLRIADGAASIVCDPWEVKLAPPDGHAKRWSLPVVVAEALLGQALWHEDFGQPPNPEAIALARLSQRESLMPNRFPQAFEAEIIVETDDGTVLRHAVADVYGNPARPARVEDVLAKFRANASRALSPAACDGLITVFTCREPHPLAALGVLLAPKEGAPA